MSVRLAVGRPHGRRGYDTGGEGTDTGGEGTAAPGVPLPSPDPVSVGVGESVGVGDVTVGVGDADDGVADGDGDDGVADGDGDVSLTDGVGDALGEPLDTVGVGVLEGVGVAQLGVGVPGYGNAEGTVLGRTGLAAEIVGALAVVVGGASVSSAVTVAHPAGVVPVGVGEPLVMTVPPSCPGLVAPPGAEPPDDARFPVPAGVPLPSVPAPPCWSPPVSTVVLA